MKTFGRADQSLQAKTQPVDDVFNMNIINIIDARACMCTSWHAQAVKEKLHLQRHFRGSMGFSANGCQRASKAKV